jgi:hypothetical protein
MRNAKVTWPVGMSLGFGSPCSFVFGQNRKPPSNAVKLTVRTFPMRGA